MNFAIAVRLIEDGVRSGAARVKASLLSIQLQAMAMAGAMAGGISGLTDLLGRMTDIARETNRVQTALRNVSDGALGYAKNLDFLKRLTSEYGLEINGATSSFAKFTAAASASGMSMSDQQKVFEGLSRGIAAFGLGGDEATLTFYAVSQMMAKGKISAEELRRQLGERMPIAIEAMSRAAKKLGFNENLDDLLKGGKLRSLDILPQFAEEIKNLTPEVNTDSLETSISRLKNSFAELVESFDIAGKMKSVVDAVRKMLDSLKESTSGLVAVVSGLIGTKLFGTLANSYKGFAEKAVAEAELKAKHAKQAMSDADTRVESTGNNLAEAQKRSTLEIDKAITAERVQQDKLQASTQAAIVREQSAKNQLLALERNHNSLIAQRNREAQGMGTRRKDYQEYVNSRQPNERTDSYDTWLAKRKKAIERHNAETLRIEASYQRERVRLEQELLRSTQEVENKRLLETKRSAEARSRLEAARARSNDRVRAAQQQHTEALTAQQAAYQANGAIANRSLSGISKAFAALRGMIASVGMALKGLMSSFVVGAIIGAISSLVMKFFELGSAIEKAKNLSQELKNEMELNVSTDRQVRQWERLVSILEDGKTSEEQRLGAIKEINKLLGTQITDAGKLLTLAKQQLQYERARAGLNSATEIAAKADRELLEFNLERKAKGLSPITEKESREAYERNKKFGLGDRAINSTMSALADVGGWLTREENGFQRKDEAFKAYALFERKRLADLAQKEAEELYLGKIDQTVPNTPEPETREDKKKKTKKVKKSPLEKAEEDYAEGLRELSNQLSAGVISQKEYNEALSELSGKAIKEIGGILGTKAAGNATFSAASLNYVAKKDESDEEKALAGYSDEAKALAAQRSRGILSEEEYRKALEDLTIKTIERLSELDNLSAGGEDILKELRASVSRGGDLASKAPAYQGRDTTFDYRKSEVDILREEQEALEDYMQKVEEGATAFNGLKDTLKELQGVAKEMDEAIKIATIREEVEELSETFSRGVYTSIKNVGSAIRSTHGSIKAMVDSLQDADASGIEKIFAVFEAITSIVDGVSAAIDTIEQLQKTKQQLAGAEQALANAQGGNLAMQQMHSAQEQSIAQKSIDLKTEEMAADTALTTTKATNMATTQAGLVADSTIKKTITTKNIAANTAEGGSNIIKSVMALPFPANLLAVGGALASVMALFKSLPKFANGGIVPGNSRSGDRVLAAVNSGELILNEAQQANIASKLINRSEGVSVDVHIKERLRGNDLRRSVGRATRVSKR